MTIDRSPWFASAVAGVVFAAVVLLAGPGCGRYGPPRRISPAPATAAPAAAPVPDPAGTPPADPGEPASSEPDREP